MITRLGKLFSPYRTFYVSLIAVVFEHQVGDTPDVYLRDHARKRYSVNLYLRLMRCQRHWDMDLALSVLSAVFALWSPAVARTAWAVVAAAREAARVGASPDRSQRVNAHTPDHGIINQRLQQRQEPRFNGIRQGDDRPPQT